MQPAQAEFLLNDIFLPGLKNEHRITRSVIEAVPSDQVDYRPNGICRSALDLAWHIAATEMRFMNAVTSGAFDLSPMPRPEPVKTPQDLGGWYAENFADHFDKLTKLSSDQLMQTVDFRGMFQLPAVMYLNFIIHHTVHHRGQLSTYLRGMGAKVPAIYGDSYDTARR